MTNIVRVADDYIPAPLRSFQKDVNELAYTSVKTFMENPEQMERILKPVVIKLSKWMKQQSSILCSTLKTVRLDVKLLVLLLTSMVIGSVS